MFSLFCVFNCNLNQLSFKLLLTKSQNIDELSIRVLSQRIELNINGKTIVFKFSECFQIKANSLQQLKAFHTNFGPKSDQNSDQNRCLQIGFTISAESAVLPQKSIPKITLPPNPELINDWIFCHNHNHKEEEDTSEPQKVEQLCHQLNTTLINDSGDQIPEMSSVLSSFDQIIKLLDETKDTKYLFESDDKKFSLFVNIINKQMILTTISDKMETNSDFLLNFLNKSSLFYKVFKNCEKKVDSELNRYRFAFDVRFFLIEIQVMKTLIQSLIESTKSILPLDLRFEKDLQLFFGYI